MINLKLHIDESFYKEEIRDGYTISSEMKKLWAVELDLLNEFMNVCKRNNIRFSADAGTILGAVRHKGIIPWDDDIDVMILREDYDKLCKIAPKEFTYPYFFQTEDTDKGSLRGHAQLRNSATTGILYAEKEYKYKFNQGIFIDIFPIENLSEDTKEVEQQCNQIALLRKKYLKYANWTKERYVRPHNKLKAFIKKIYYILMQPYVRYIKNPHKIYKEYEKELTRCKDTKTSKISKLALGKYENRRIWNRKDLEETIEVPFEMLTIPIPKGYKNILDTFYGSWQEFKIGTSTHGEIFFDVNNSYHKYINEKE